MKNNQTIETRKGREEAYKLLIETIGLFETEEAKFYWIDKLPCCEAVKGFLVNYYKL